MRTLQPSLKPAPQLKHLKTFDVGIARKILLFVKVPLLFIASLNVLHNSIPVQFRSTATGQLRSFQLHHKLSGALQLVQVGVPTDDVTKSSFRHSSSGLGSPQAAGFVGSSVVVCGEIPECYLVKCDPKMTYLSPFISSLNCLPI